jgi:hypothetical protein
LNQAETAPEPQSADADNTISRDAVHSDFAATRPDAGLEPAVDWWPESADGQCSENAALFATSQSAPLNVV